MLPTNGVYVYTKREKTKDTAWTTYAQTEVGDILDENIEDAVIVPADLFASPGSYDDKHEIMRDFISGLFPPSRPGFSRVHLPGPQFAHLRKAKPDEAFYAPDSFHESANEWLPYGPKPLAELRRIVEEVGDRVLVACGPYAICSDHSFVELEAAGFVAENVACDRFFACCWLSFDPDKPARVAKLVARRKRLAEKGVRDDSPDARIKTEVFCELQAEMARVIREKTSFDEYKRPGKSELERALIELHQTAFLFAIFFGPAAHRSLPTFRRLIELWPKHGAKTEKAASKSAFASKRVRAVCLWLDAEAKIRSRSKATPKLSARMSKHPLECSGRRGES